ncbi:carbohydrate kinase [Kovacikia minuta CCNUW1]|uniref:carbohydrate kinase family protein n=1 Tax=Kovacikia minuta TaxID=2931930 RepID=UPI001CCC3276|nr:carbohydrate kinase [Kovacikia minuta]UBF26039.1 carbohydrate kinase [Kovacikia minuta CCNUW1]
MTQPRVLCLGEILYDFLSDQPGLPLEQVKSWTPYPGGAPANVACGLTKLGTLAGFIGCVGQDDLGASLVKLLEEIGVDETGIQRHPTAPTRAVYVVRSETGERHFAGFGENDTATFADTHLQAANLPVASFEKAEFLVLGTLELAYPEARSAILQALDLADQNYVKILIDVNWRPVFWKDPAIAPAMIHDLVSYADFLKLSEEEAEWLYGTTEPGVIAHRVGNLEGVIVTAGEKGCAYYLGENEGKLPAFAVEVEDTTGAGDSFVAGLLHQLCQHGIRSLSDPTIASEIVQYASAMGALTATKPGAIAAQPTAAEVEAFLYLKQQPS